MDAEAPRIVMEQPAACADGARAEEALRRALAPGMAPGEGWTVTLRVSRTRAVLHAEGTITDGSQAPVAGRVIDRETNDCASLARAIGVWASLVLDDEVQRAEIAEAARQVKAAPEPAAGEGWALPASRDRAPDPVFLAHPEGERSFELGVTTHLMSGTGTGTIAGVSIFTVSEAASGWFLRPAVAIGRSTAALGVSNDVYATWGAARLDACKRLPGNYLEKRGIQLDLCGGADLGFLYFDAPSTTVGTPGNAPQGFARTSPFVAVGPSVAFRGELGNELAVWVRGIVELNLVRQGFTDGAGTSVDPSWLVGRGEVGVSWRLK